MLTLPFLLHNVPKNDHSAFSINSGKKRVHIFFPTEEYLQATLMVFQEEKGAHASHTIFIFFDLG